MLDEFAANHPMRSYNLIFGFMIAWAIICVVVSIHQIMKRQANAAPTPITLEALYSHPAEPEWVEVSGWITKDEWMYYVRSTKSSKPGLGGYESKYIAIRLQERQVDPVHVLVDVSGIENNQEELQSLSKGIVKGTRRQLPADHRRLMEGVGPPSPGNDRAPWPLAATTEVIVAGDRPGSLGLAAALCASVILFGGFAFYGLQVLPRRRLREKSMRTSGLPGRPASSIAPSSSTPSQTERPPWESGARSS